MLGLSPVIGGHVVCPLCGANKCPLAARLSAGPDGKKRPAARFVKTRIALSYA